MSGSIIMSAIGKAGIAVWSPPLNKYGNSVRGDHVCQGLVARMPRMHMFESVVRAAVEKRENAKSAALNQEVSMGKRKLECVRVG